MPPQLEDAAEEVLGTGPDLSSSAFLFLLFLSLSLDSSSFLMLSSLTRPIILSFLAALKGENLAFQRPNASHNW